MKRRTMLTRAAILAVAALLTGGWSRTPAVAVADASGWVTTPDGLPLFDLAAVAPGQSGQATLIVTNPQLFKVTLTLSIASLRDDDNGCTEPEQAAGDSTCGAGGGELQDDLRMTLTNASTDSVLADDTVSDLAALQVVDPVALNGNETRTYHVGYELPIGASNMTQSDLVAFEFELVLEQEDGSEVASEAVPATPSLPATGGDNHVVVVLVVGLVLVATGLVLYWLSVRRRPTRS